MVLVQLFIMKIALSNWAAPSYPFPLLLCHTAAPPLSQHTHKLMYSADVLVDFIITIQ